MAIEIDATVRIIHGSGRGQADKVIETWRTADRALALAETLQCADGSPGLQILDITHGYDSARAIGNPMTHDLARREARAILSPADQTIEGSDAHYRAYDLSEEKRAAARQNRGRGSDRGYADPDG